MRDPSLPAAPRRRDSAKAMAAIALAASFTPTLLRRRRQDQAAISLAAAGLGAAAGAATEALVVRLAARLDGGEPAARLALVTAGALSAGFRLPAARHDAVALAGTAAGVAGVGAIVGALSPVRDTGRRLDPRWAAAALVATGGLAVAWRRATRRSRSGTRTTLTEYPAERWLPTVSGGEGSLVPRATLDFEGTRFLAGAVPAEEITAFTGRPAQDPVRVFVGLRSAPTIAARCRLAADELERLGAFRRRRIVVCSATLRGYVNPVPVATEEVLADGDVASVVVQFNAKRVPWRMATKIPAATATHRVLLRVLEQRLAALGDHAPELCVYGESMGAWASQNVFRDDGVAGLDRLRVRRALWVGTPAFSRMARLVRRGRLPLDERVGALRARDIVVGDPEDDRLRFLFFHRVNDPVVLFPGVQLIWRRPEWLDARDATRRGDLVPPGTRWVPGVTFLQVAVDLVRSTAWTADVPQRVGHDYRVELPLVVNVAFGHRAPRARVEELGRRLNALEVARARRVRALRRGREPEPLPRLTDPPAGAA